MKGRGLLLALGVPCSAQLGVILGMIRSLSLGATLVWAGSVAVTLFALGGYTTWRARSSCLEEQAEPKVRETILALLKDVAAAK